MNVLANYPLTFYLDSLGTTLKKFPELIFSFVISLLC